MATPRRTRWRRLPTTVREHLIRLTLLAGRNIRDAMHAHPRLGLAGLALIATGVTAAVLSSAPDPAVMRTTPITLPERADFVDGATPATAAPPGIIEAVSETTHQPTGDSNRWQIVEIRSGQTLEQVFRQLGLSARLLHEVVNVNEQTRGLAQIRPGDRFAFDIDPESGFRAMRAELDEAAWLFVERQGDLLSSRTEPRHLERRIVEASGVITTSLYHAARQAGLSDNMTMRLATIFGWDIDFALDIRTGDHFALIYEEVWRDGERLRDGDILAARFVNRGDSFEAVRFDAGNGADYFAPDGRPMRKAFLRTPLNFSRVSSNFNPRRLHPVTRRVRPHNGTDYAAPTGTPVWAAGDGKVVEAGYTATNGNYVFIQHGNSIVTRYLHLSRKHVKRGERVRQGQTIGRVGATGLATGPHLHYEFVVNGVHRNPRTIDLPPADPLPGDLLDEFGRLGRPLLARLDSLAPSDRLLAATLSGGCETGGQSC